MAVSSAGPSVLRTALRIGVGVSLTAFLVWIPRSQLGATPDHANLRLSLRRAGGVIQECRTLSASELEKLAAHMRRPEVCESTVVPYWVTATSNGHTLLRQQVFPAGARGDRPMVVEELVPIPAGRQQIRVTFSPEGIAPTTDVTFLKPHALAATIGAVPGRIYVVFLDNEDHDLVLH